MSPSHHANCACPAETTLQQVQPRSRTLLAAVAFLWRRRWKQRDLNDRLCVIFSASAMMEEEEMDTTASNGAIRAKGPLWIACQILRCNFSATAPICTCTVFTGGSFSHTCPSNDHVFADGDGLSSSLVAREGLITTVWQC